MRGGGVVGGRVMFDRLALHAGKDRSCLQDGRGGDPALTCKQKVSGLPIAIVFLLDLGTLQIKKRIKGNPVATCCYPECTSLLQICD